MFRLGLGALPFLLPLMLQIGFGMTPFQSGMITFATALGAMGMKWATATILRRFGFRNILVINSIISAAFLAVAPASLPTTPMSIDDDPAAGRRIFPLAAIHQHQHHRLCRCRAAPRSAGRPRWSASRNNWRSRPASPSGRWRWNSPFTSKAAARCKPATFPPAFLAVAAISALSVFIFARLPPEAGAEMADRLPTPAEPSDQRAG